MDPYGDDDAEAWGDDPVAWGGEVQAWGGEPQGWGGHHHPRRRIMKRKRKQGWKTPLPPLSPETVVVVGRDGWTRSEPRTPQTPTGAVVVCQDHGPMTACMAAPEIWYCHGTLADGSPCTARYQGRCT